MTADEEQKLGDAARRLSASAFLARYGSFRYIETRSEMSMSDKKTPFASVSLTAFFAKDACEQGSKLDPLQGISNRELPMLVASASRASNATRGLCFASPNRERQLLEPVLTHRKQTVALCSNGELSTNRSCGNSRLSGALLSNGLPRQIPVLTGSAPQTEIDVTCSKQTTEKFLTGARTHIRETRICAKMSAQISSKLSAQMSGIR